MGEIRKTLLTAVEYAESSYNPRNADNITNISIPSTDTQVTITKNPSDVPYDIVVSFRGTDSLKDIICNLKFWKKSPRMFSGDKYNIHKGFMEQYESIRDKILEETKGYSRVLVSSHSLGGAIGVLFALDLSHKRPDTRIMCVTFGSPRVGGSHFANDCNSTVSHIRCVHNKDIITRLPLFRFKHSGALWRIKTPGMNMFASHKISNYREAIKRHFSGSNV